MIHALLWIAFLVFAVWGICVVLYHLYILGTLAWFAGLYCISTSVGWFRRHTS
jgi:hypothetical protein